MRSGQQTIKADNNKVRPIKPLIIPIKPLRLIELLLLIEQSKRLNLSVDKFNNSIDLPAKDTKN